jgi:hypothetical protein
MKEFRITFEYVGGRSMDHLDRGESEQAIRDKYLRELSDFRFVAITDDLVINSRLVTQFLVKEIVKDENTF